MGRTQPSDPVQRRGIHSHGPIVTTTSSASSALSCCGQRVAQSEHPAGTSSSVLLGPKAETVIPVGREVLNLTNGAHAVNAITVLWPSRATPLALPVAGLTVVPARGTLLARDGSHDVVTPYDDCVLIMPTRRPKRGETAVRLGRFVPLDATR